MLVERGDDPLLTPRCPCQPIVAAAAVVLVEHVDGNLQLAGFSTFSAPELNEAGAVRGLFELLADTPPGADIVTPRRGSSSAVVTG